MPRSLRALVRAAVIAALYVGMCFVVPVLAYGPVQIRFSEALTLLPVVCPEAVLGVTVGCLLANTLSFSPVDMLVGTLATLLAALATRRLRGVRWYPRWCGRRVQDVVKPCPADQAQLNVGRGYGIPLLASLPPVLFNAVIVGAEISILYTPGVAMAGWLLNMGSVGLGQVVSCVLIGLPLLWVIERQPVLRRLFGGEGT